MEELNEGTSHVRLALIGRTLYGRKRYEEFEALLNWLAVAIPKN